MALRLPAISFGGSACQKHWETSTLERKALLLKIFGIGISPISAVLNTPDEDFKAFWCQKSPPFCRYVWLPETA